MWPEKLVNKISLLAQYIESCLEIVDKLEQSLDKMTLEAMRKSAVDDINFAYQKIMFEVEKEERLTSIYSEVYISSGYLSNGTTYCLSPNTDRYIDQKDRDDFYLGEGILSLRVEVFKNLMSELRTSIQKGKLNEQIHFTANHLIYNKLHEASKKWIESTCMQPEKPILAGVFVDNPEGKIISYVCPYCKSHVPAPYFSKNRMLTCVSCGDQFPSDKTFSGPVSKY